MCAKWLFCDHYFAVIYFILIILLYIALNIKMIKEYLSGISFELHIKRYEMYIIVQKL